MKDFKYSLHHCFIDKTKLVRRNITTELEYLVHTVQKDILLEELEKFHEYLLKMTNKFTQSIFHTRDNAYHDLRHLRSNKDIALLSVEKDFPVVIVLLAEEKDFSAVVKNKVDYVKKVNNMINEGIQHGNEEMTTDTTYEDLEKFQGFFYYIFKSHPSCLCDS